MSPRRPHDFTTFSKIFTHTNRQYAFNWQNNTSSFRLDWINLLYEIKVGTKYEKLAFSNAAVASKFIQKHLFRVESHGQKRTEIPLFPVSIIKNDKL